MRRLFAEHCKEAWAEPPLKGGTLGLAQKVLWGGCFEPKSTGTATPDFFQILGGPGKGFAQGGAQGGTGGPDLLGMQEKSWEMHKMHAEPMIKSYFARGNAWSGCYQGQNI